MQINSMFDEHMDVTYTLDGNPTPAMILAVRYDNGIIYDIWLWVSKEKRDSVPENELQP